MLQKNIAMQLQNRKAMSFSTVLLPTIPLCTAILFLPKLSKQCHFYKKKKLKQKKKTSDLTIWSHRVIHIQFLFTNHPQITHKGFINKGNDHQQNKLLVLKQILLVCTLGNVWRTVWGICILMLGCKGLRDIPWFATLKHCGAASKYAIQMLYTSQSLKIL